MKTSSLIPVVVILSACGAELASQSNPDRNKNDVRNCTAQAPLDSGTQSSLAGVWGSSATDIYVAGDSSTALHAAGAKAPFTPLAVGQPGPLQAVWGSGPSDIYMVGFGSSIVHSSDGGQTWVAQDSGVPIDPQVSPEVLMGVWGSSASDVYAVGTQGVIVHSTGDGHWTQLTSTTFDDLFAVWGSGPGDVFVVGDSGKILHSSDGGRSWVRQISHSQEILRGVWGSASNDVYVVGSFGTVLHSADGKTWLPQNSNTPIVAGAAFFGIWGSGPNDIYVVGDFGMLIHSDNGGQSWDNIDSGTTNPLNAVFGSSANDVFIVGDGGIVLHSTGCGQAGGMTFAESRIAQKDIDAGKFTAEQLNLVGRFLFGHVFTQDEGLGNNLGQVAGTLAGPGARPNIRRIHNSKFGGPDNAGADDASQGGRCITCHIVGGADGGGDLNHTLLQDGDGLNRSNALLRNGRSMMGDGYVQQLGIEMTADLKQQLASAKTQAQATQIAQTVALTSKGVGFGSLTARPDGTLDSSQLQGVDADLVVKPHGWKGRVATLRRFVEGGFQVHFGMQTEVLTTTNCAKANPNVVGNGPVCQDPDNDGVLAEVTEGQLTAMSLYSAMRSAPVQVLPSDPTKLARAQAGRQLFAQVGCVSCHVATLSLKSPIHAEPPDLTGGAPFIIDLTKDPEDPRLTANSDGTVTVPLFSDLKRHDMGASLADPHASFGVIAPNLFLTPPLWDVGSTPPYLHDGRAPTLQAAIVAHDGEGLPAQAAFRGLDADSQAKIVEFLQTLQTRPAKH